MDHNGSHKPLPVFYHIIKNENFLRTSCALSILVQFSKFQTVNLGVRHPSRIPSDRLLFDETFAQPCIFVVVNCVDVALNAFYFPVLTCCRIFL